MISSCSGPNTRLSATYHALSDPLTSATSKSSSSGQWGTLLPPADSNCTSAEPQKKKTADFTITFSRNKTVPLASFDEFSDLSLSAESSLEELHKLNSEQEITSSSRNPEPTVQTEQPALNISLTRTISKHNFTPLIGRQFTLQTNNERICIFGGTRTDALDANLDANLTDSEKSKPLKEVKDESNILGWYQVMVARPDPQTKRPADNNPVECSGITTVEPPVSERVRLVYLPSHFSWDVDNSNAKPIPIQKVRNDDGTFRYCVNIESKPYHNISACILSEDSAEELRISMVSTSVKRDKIEKAPLSPARKEPVYEAYERTESSEPENDPACANCCGFFARHGSIR